MDIPVELISISEKKQIMQLRFGMALLWLLFSTLTFVIIALALDLQDNKLSTEIYAIVSAIIVIIPFISLIVWSFFRQRTVCLTIAPKNGEISFWVEKKNKTAIDNLISELIKRKELVQETIPYPMQSAIGDQIRQPWKRTIILTLLLSYPATVLEQPKLLFLCLIPVIMHIWHLIFLFRQPALYNDAVALYFDKQWDKAIANIEQLLRQSPSYVPGYLLFIQILLKLDQYGKAENILGRVQNQLDPELANSIHLEIINRKRLFDRKTITV
ncbi:MAG: tetratricopeptide repeat protein [bacterium]